MSYIDDEEIKLDLDEEDEDDLDEVLPEDDLGVLPDDDDLADDLLDDDLLDDEFKTFLSSSKFVIALLSTNLLKSLFEEIILFVKNKSINKSPSFALIFNASTGFSFF